MLTPLWGGACAGFSGLTDSKGMCLGPEVLSDAEATRCFPAKASVISLGQYNLGLAQSQYLGTQRPPVF